MHSEFLVKCKIKNDLMGLTHTNVRPEIDREEWSTACLFLDCKTRNDTMGLTLINVRLSIRFNLKGI